MINSSRITSASRKRFLEAKKKTHEASAREKALFDNCLDKVHSQSVKGNLDKLVRSIQNEGERLSHFRSLTQLEHYKKKIREFLKQVSRNTFKVKATGFMDAQGDYSTQLIVEKVDGALEALTKIVLNKESQTFQILQKLDLIKGMLTDIYQ